MKRAFRAWPAGLLLGILAPLATAGKVDRVIVIKVDGLPADFLERIAAGNPSKLPWIRKVFVQNGARLDNFYVRGLSLSAPSWSLLDTGRHLAIRGNVEYDRYTLRAYDYLNFFPFYLGYARWHRADTTGVELLDELGIPLLIDRFPVEGRYQSPQLLQRGLRWTALSSTLKRAFGDHTPKQIFDEWQTGLPWSKSWDRASETELIDNLKNPEVRYLDFFATDYDHIAHLTADRQSQLHELEVLDDRVGRIWNAVAASAYPETTAIFMVSDHGMNSQEGVYSQGFDLVSWFSHAEGGGHHVLTNRHPLTEFKLRGLDPFVDEVITPSTESAYLNGESANYPTVMLDLDGNERASIGLRSNTLNKLHVLLDQLVRKRIPGPVRGAALKAFFSVRDEVAPSWKRDLTELTEELEALDLRIARQQVVASQPKKFTKAQRDEGLDKDFRRAASRLEALKLERRQYTDYAAAIRRLLALDPADFDPGKFKMESVIPPKSLGPGNSVYDLQHYVVGPAVQGLVLAPDGSLDLRKSLREINYLEELSKIGVRNSVQAEVSAQPVDFIATRLSREELADSLDPEDLPEREAIWLWRGQEKQALILSRHRTDGALELRYVPISHLSEDASGHARFNRVALSEGFPLALCEDTALAIGTVDRTAWLAAWHTDREWFEATYRTRYSNGIVGLAEELLELDTVPSATADDRMHRRERNLRRTDLLVFANNHWNFNVRGFNPGGNHGSFFNISTHSVLMAAGGKETGLPRGARIDAPYDSLSFVPTVLKLMGRPEPQLPGPVIRELIH